MIQPGKPWQHVGETYKSFASPEPRRQGSRYSKKNSGGATALRFGAVGLLRAGSKKAVLFPLKDVLAPAVLTLSPDQAMLAVGDSQSRFSWSFQIGTFYRSICRNSRGTATWPD